MKALETWRKGITTVVKNGIIHGQIKRTVDADYYADLLISLVEGAVMQSKVYSDKKHLQNCFKRIDTIIENEILI